jgi:hypothetical protein
MLELGVYVIGFSFPVVPRGAGPDPHPDVGGAYIRTHRPDGRGVQTGGYRTGSDLMTDTMKALAKTRP